MKLLKYVYVACLAILVLAVAGCARIASEITIDSDFSGKWTSAIILPQAMSRAELDNTIAESMQSKKKGEPTEADKKRAETIQKVMKNMKLQVVDPTGKKIDATEPQMKSTDWEVNATFDNAEELAAVQNIIFGAVGRSKIENAVYPYGDNPDVYTINLGRAPGFTTIIVDGKILPDTKTQGNIQENKITFAEGKDIRFEMEKTSHMVRNIFIGIVVIAIGVGGFVVYKRRQ